MLRLLVAAGGTGGGVYPALAVVGAIVASAEDVDVLWVGGEGGMEASLLNRAHLAFQAIPAAGLHGVGFSKLPKNLWQMLRGVLASSRILRWFDPDVLFYTGGYVGVPVAFAGRKKPQAMFVPDVEPALALRWISRWVKAIAVTSDASQQYYQRTEKVKLTGYPTRPELVPVEPGIAREKLNLASDQPTILVFGGSRGARSINRALVQGLPELLEKMQVLHITGELDWDDVKSEVDRFPADLLKRYRYFKYVHDEMATLFSAADMVISRAGAAVLGEYPLFGLPAILVPYPHAWRYQWVNARYLEERGAAVILRDEDIGRELVRVISELMDDAPRREGMSAAMRELHRPNAAERIAEILVTLAEGGETPRG